MNESVVDKILLIIQLATAASASIPAASEYTEYALKFEQIAKAALAAHEQITGQPYDASKLQAIDPIP